MIRVQVVDPSAFTPPYDRALCAALARAGASVELITSRFAYGELPAPEGYAVRELFYGRALGPPGSRRRRAAKLAGHLPAMRRGAGNGPAPAAQYAQPLHRRHGPLSHLPARGLRRRIPQAPLLGSP